MLGRCFFFCGIWLVCSGVGHVFAETVRCPGTLPHGNDAQTLNNVAIYEGRPEEQAGLLPDSDPEMVWTLRSSQQYVKDHNTSVYMSCEYKNSANTAAIKVPLSAEKCVATLEDNQRMVGYCQ